MRNVIRITTDNDAVYKADQAVKDFVKSHGKKLNESERKELGGLLKDRAKALSDVLGTKVDSVVDD